MALKYEPTERVVLVVNAFPELGDTGLSGELRGLLALLFRRLSHVMGHFSQLVSLLAAQSFQKPLPSPAKLCGTTLNIQCTSKMRSWGSKKPFIWGVLKQRALECEVFGLVDVQVNGLLGSLLWVLGHFVAYLWGPGE